MGSSDSVKRVPPANEMLLDTVNVYTKRDQKQTASSSLSFEYISARRSNCRRTYWHQRSTSSAATASARLRRNVTAATSAGHRAGHPCLPHRGPAHARIRHASRAPDQQGAERSARAQVDEPPVPQGEGHGQPDVRARCDSPLFFALMILHRCPQCHKRLGNSVIAVHAPR